MTWPLAGLLIAGVLLWLLVRPRAVRPRAGRGAEETSLCVAERSGPVIRFATYNIHGGRDDDNRDNLERVAGDLRGADIVALQEVRDSWKSPRQAHRLAELMRLPLLNAPTRHAWFRNERGNALLSRLPLGRWVRLPLPHQHGRHKHFRNITLCELEHDRRVVVLVTHVNTHKGGENPAGQDDQLRAVLELFFEHSPAVLMGDFNTRKDHPLIREALARPEVVDALGDHAPADDPSRKDWILCRGMEVTAAGYADSKASDHPMYWCDARVAESPTVTDARGELREPATLIARARERLYPEGRPWQPWRRAGLRNWLLGLGLAAAATGSTSSSWIAAGSLLLLAGAMLIFLARSHLENPDALCDSGPYRLMRHPCYAGNALLDLGLAVMSGLPALMAVLPLWWAAIYAPLIRREETALLERFGEAYQRYRDSTPALLPATNGWRNVLAGLSGSTWHHQMGHLFRFASYPLLFLIAARFHERGTELLLNTSVVEGLLLASVPGLVLFAVVWNRHFVDQQVVLHPYFQRLESRLALIGVVMMAGMLHAAVETEFYTLMHWIPGLALLPVSAVIANRMQHRLYLPEAILAVSLALLLEVEWMVPLLVPLYVAMALDAPRTRKRRGPVAPLPRPVYLSAVSAGLIMAVSLELATAF